MAETIVVAGLTAVKVDTGSANALELLGYSRDGVDAEYEGYFSDVPGDQNGGESGPPIDVQFMGEIAIVRLELTKWDTAVAAKIRPRTYGGTAGTPTTPGSLMFQGSLSYRLLLHSATTIPQNFPRAFPRHRFVINRGTRFSRLVCEFECHKNASGVLYNETTS